MRGISEKNSQAAAAFAAKKREQLERANALKAEMKERASSSAPNVYTMVNRSRLQQENDATDSESFFTTKDGGASVAITSYGNFCDRIVVRDPNSNAASRQPPISIGYDNDMEELASKWSSSNSSSGRVTSRRQQMVLAKARIKVTASSDIGAPASVNAASHYSSVASRSDSLATSGGFIGRARANEYERDVYSEGSSFMRPRACHGGISGGGFTPTSFASPPVEPAGTMVDLSDRLILCASHFCSSSSSSAEVVMGTADHALYAIDVNNPTQRPVRMYGKKYGHTDWVSSVSHLADGRVVSAGMDSRLLLWTLDKRSCADLRNAHTMSISKVVSDKRFNVAISCGYDKRLALWAFGHHRERDSVPSGPSDILTGHSSAVVDATFRDNIAATVDRDGGLVFWDVSSAEQIGSYLSAHKGAITALDQSVDQGESCVSRVLFMTGGADGCVKLWDPRNSRPCVMKADAHVQVSNNGNVDIIRQAKAKAKPAISVVASLGNGSRKPSNIDSGKSSASSSMPLKSVKAATVTCLASLSSRGGDLSYVVSGGSDDALVLMDSRKSLSVVQSWRRYHKTGLYSMCTAGDGIVFTGDGAGVLMCFDLLRSSSCTDGDISAPFPTAAGAVEGYSTGRDDKKSDTALKYGICASQAGAVRTISCVAGKIVTGAEDGKAIVFTYL